MDSLTVFGLSSSLPIHKTTNISTPGTTFPHSKPKSFQTHHQNVSNRKAKTSSCSLKIPSTTRTSNSLQTHLLLLKKASSSLMLQLSLALVTTPLSSFASETETIISSSSSDKISLESVLVSIDDFNNRNPFFVAGCTFIWLVVIPLAQEYVLKKYKFVSAIDAFRKLKDEPNSQLLDIRDNKSVSVLPSPNLKILSKSASQIQFMDGKEEGFVKKVLENFKDPRNTTLYVIDNFDGKSLQVAELLVKNGFKEAYAIKGGIRGKDGWQEIQETLLPPSVHVFAKTDNRKTKEQLETSDAEVSRKTTSNGNSPSVSNKTEAVKENGSTMSIQPTSQPNLKQQKMLSPYPNYPDLKPPSSPTPSKPSL